MHIRSSTHTDHDFARMIAFLSYLTIVGWLAAILLFGHHKQDINKRQFASFHLRQSLGLIITAAILSFIPLIGWVMNLVIAVFWLISAFYALKGEYYCVPWLGNEYQNQLRFIA